MLHRLHTSGRFLQVFLLKRKLLLKGVGVTLVRRCPRDGRARLWRALEEQVLHKEMSGCIVSQFHVASEWRTSQGNSEGRCSH